LSPSTSTSVMCATGVWSRSTGRASSGCCCGQ
jgi:hypothetical protein